ncbi:DUF871 domain-containing protein [Bacillus sp. FJAT-42376]|uniref:MupG family TIM beta-alpha barrel fold protein n=1 Tax=Bacillus sp. FJAT-42376 TaxID=2014076 RepID=UPI000F4D57C0|nr:MupG family TIM beta-alpha barrel fold protein [Bacillus sp. FJAT-42376]AZB43106.1 DUF871 domain-containing protein [Bacillus sp. FJAT-42376]
MIGISFYLHDEQAEERIWEAGRLGVKHAFTSLHIPEDKGDMAQKAKVLLAAAKEAGIQVFADVSAGTPAKLGLSSFSSLKSLGVTGLRLDDGFKAMEAAEISKEFSIAVNASILFERELQDLFSHGAAPDSIVAWHNFYPRRETGLDDAFFRKQNQLFKQYGMSTAAFIPGRMAKRGPLFEGLPTLEKHRSADPVHAAIELQQLDTDHVFIGDADFSDGLLEDLLLYSCENTIKIKISSDIPLKKNYKVRPDLSRDVIRLLNTRTEDSVPPFRCVARKAGSLTMDNDLYGRYRGEIQIVKHHLPADERVNVIGWTAESDLPLLELIQPGQKLLFIQDEENKRLGGWDR